MGSVPEVSKTQRFEDPDPLPNPDTGADVGVEEIEIEVLDDTPEADNRGARPAADRVDVDSEEFEREVQNYSENAQQRIKAVKFEFHEERRAKEAAQRQSDEATRYAESVASDNAALKSSLQNSNTVLIEQYGARTDAELETARTEFKEAYEGGDTDKLLMAQEKLAQLHAERVGALAQRTPRPVPQAGPETSAPSPRLSTPDARGAKWMRDNNWFQNEGYETMPGYAIGLHQQLVKRGFDPRIHEDYYSEIDKGLRAVFPDHFSNDGSEGRDQGGKGRETSAATPSGRKPPVGGPSRGGKPPRTVQLTTTQVALAKRLGLTNKQYAAQVVKEAANG